MTSTVLAATTSILRAVVLSARGRVRALVVVLTGEAVNGVAGAVAGIGAVASVMAGAGEPVVGDGGFGNGVFFRGVDGTRFFDVDILGASAARWDFFTRVDEVRFFDVFGVCMTSLPASADTSSVQRTPVPARADGILIARFDNSGSPFPRPSRQFTYRDLAEENHRARRHPITERSP